MGVFRTEVQREADMADLDLYRVICRLEELAFSNLGNRDLEEKLRGIVYDLKECRPALRSLMHPRDREATS